MPFDIGVMFWASDDLPNTLRELRSLRFHRGQMAIPGELAIDGVAESWRTALHHAGMQVQTLFGVYPGESYADIRTVQRTVGFIPRETRAERETRTIAIADLAAELGIPGIATHIGFVPEDRLDPDYITVLEMVRRIADHAEKHDITFALETGQETADALLDFLLEVNRENVGVNFDPANMILYGTGDPVDALETVGQHVLTVHCKDGDWPRESAPGSLGTEMPIGQGRVDFRAFLAMLRKLGYERPLFIERETEDREERIRDISNAKDYLERLAAEE